MIMGDLREFCDHTCQQDKEFHARRRTEAIRRAVDDERERCYLLCKMRGDISRASAAKLRKDGTFTTRSIWPPFKRVTCVFPKWEEAAHDLDLVAEAFYAVAKGIREGWDPRNIPGADEKVTIGKGPMMPIGYQINDVGYTVPISEHDDPMCSDAALAGYRVTVLKTADKIRIKPPCECQEKMGNDFWYLPTGACLRDDKTCTKGFPCHECGDPMDCGSWQCCERGHGDWPKDKT